MKKLILISLFISGSLFAQSETTISEREMSSSFTRPKSLKALSLTLQGSYQENPGQVDKETAASNGFVPKQLQSETLELNLSTKWLFKPLKKLILIDTFKINSLFHNPGSGQDRLPFEDRVELKNDLVGVYVLNRNNQIGNLLRTNFVRGNSFQISDLPGIQELNDNHYMIQNMLFYQHKFARNLSTRFNFGGKLIDYEDAYSGFSGAAGEQNDHIAGIITIENKWVIDKNAVLKIPLSFRREFYKNRIALNSNGTFNTTGALKERDDLEIYEAGLEFLIRMNDFRLTTGVTAVQQTDNIQGGRSYEGYRAKIEATVPTEEFELTAHLNLNDFEYDTALVNSTLTGSSFWREKGYSYGAKGKVFVNSHISLMISAQKQVARDNFFAGNFENDIFQLGLEYKL